MAFTDDDLKRLKEERMLCLDFPCRKTKDLLARLEAGERLIKALKNKENTTEEQIAWEKSCGL